MREKINNLRNFGIRGEEHVVDVGMNAKMNEFAAIMGLCNLMHFETALKKRKENYNYYRNRLKTVKGIRFLDRNSEASNNYGYFPIVVEQEYGKTRDELYEYLKERDILTRKYFYPLTSDQECFRNKYKGVKLECARVLSKKVLALPFYDEIQKADIDLIADLIKNNACY